MSTDLVTTPRETAGALAEQVAIAGDLSKLSPDQRMAYYGEVCRSLSLNPLTKPFQYLQLNGKLVLYATRDATDQLRQTRKVSISITGRERIDDVYVVTARATTPDGRSDEATGVVALGNKRGDDLANALMKAETKAKRRVTLSICGLSWMDETELETVREARPVLVADASSPADDTASLQAHVKALRDVERSYLAQPPAFSWNKSQSRAPLEAEIIAARGRIADALSLDPADYTDEQLMQAAYTAYTARSKELDAAA